MDDDLSQENRIRLIGRLFFILNISMLMNYLIERNYLSNNCQNLSKNYRYLGVKFGAVRANLGQTKSLNIGQVTDAVFSLLFHLGYCLALIPVLRE
jgi:hypothetical protein